MEGLSPVSGKRKDAEESLLGDGAGSIKKLKRTLTQEHDLKVIGSGEQHLVFKAEGNHGTQNAVCQVCPSRRSGLPSSLIPEGVLPGPRDAPHTKSPL